MSHIEHSESLAVPLSRNVRFWVWDEARSAEGLELSDQGIFLKTSTVLEEGRHVTVRLELPAHQRITVLGKVVRTVKGGVLGVAGIGVRFLDLTPSQRDAIARFVTDRSTPQLVAA